MARWGEFQWGQAHWGTVPYLSREEEQRLYPQLTWKEALALIGPRRAGKTTLAVRLLDVWRAKGGQGGYFDLEELGAPTTAEKLAGEIAKTPKGSLVVLDEVQVVDGWEKVVRSQVERSQRHVIVSGSSASLLSSEIASSLGGRAMPETVLPLSFRDAKRWGLKSLQQYLEVGGYPECVLRPEDASRLHKLYMELTVLRDVAARKGIREIKPLSDLALILLSEPGKTISAKKTSSILGISQPTFRSFASALNDAFLVLSVPPFVLSPREKLVADARHYAYDTGLQKSVSASGQEDSGRRLENAVAVELVRRGYRLSYLPGKDCECDFIAQKSGAKTLAVQVWGGGGKIPEREFEGLALGMRVAKASGLLLCGNAFEELAPRNAEAKTVEEWLLSGQKQG